MAKYSEFQYGDGTIYGDGGANVLVVANAAHAQTAGAVALTQHNILVVADAEQAQVAGAVVLKRHREAPVWEADFESGVDTDYWTVAPGACAVGGKEGTYLYKASHYPFGYPTYKDLAESTNEGEIAFWFWYHALNATNEKKVIRFANGTYAPLTLALADDGKLEIHKGDFGATVQLDITDDAPLAVDTWGYIEARWRLHATGGCFVVYLDGNEILSYVGDTTSVADPGPVNRVEVECFFADDYRYDSIRFWDSLPADAVMTPGDAEQAHSVDGPLDLTQHSTLALADCLHAHTVDGLLTLIQHNVLAASAAAHAQTAEAPVLAERVTPLPDDAYQAHTAEEVDFIQHHVLATDGGAAHLQTAEACVLVTHPIDPGTRRSWDIAGRMATTSLSRECYEPDERRSHETGGRATYRAHKRPEHDADDR
jgi:hypothetical protein